MKKSFLYVILLASFVIGITLGRCEESFSEECQNAFLMAGLDGFMMLEAEKDKSYSPPSSFLADLKSKGCDVAENSLMQKVGISYLSFFHGEVAVDSIIYLSGGAVNMIAPGVGSVLATSATALNHGITFVPMGSALRGVLLNDFTNAMAPKITPVLKSTADYVLLPAAKASWWAIGKTAPMAWDFTNWLTTKGYEKITDYTKLISRFWDNSISDSRLEEIEMSEIKTKI
ncbi:MAG: hypothetical protein K2P90_04830 [Holosporales bacterium]|nr:hypothetical protein [Holosporales bacterium]